MNIVYIAMFKSDRDLQVTGVDILITINTVAANFKIRFKFMKSIINLVNNYWVKKMSAYYLHLFRYYYSRFELIRAVIIRHR